jgi:hypothetical protein
MKKLLVLVCTALAVGVGAKPAFASWSSLHYSGYQPWWNIFAKRYKCLTPEEERLQKFWHDYYDAMKNYYCALDHIDWVAYYKNHGYQINGCCGGPCGSGRINYAPVFVSPMMQWAIPQGPAGGPPCGPGFGGPGFGGPGPMAAGPMPMFAPMPGGPMGPGPMPGPGAPGPVPPAPGH